MYRKQKGYAFTLVELIVVITILAILGTIGFISLIGFQKIARESARVSDINTIARALGFFYTQENFYPNPTDSFDITFSGSLAWKQGIFGIDTQVVTERISEIPVDPLTGNEYAYSTINTKQEYQLGAISESLLSQESSSILFQNQAHATSSYYSNVKGNYNGQIVTVREPTKLYVLGVPTIITSEITDISIQEIIANGSFAYKNGKDLPGSYSGSLINGQTIDDLANRFEPGNLTDTSIAVIYEGTIEDLSNESDRQKFADNLVSYYQGSNLSESNLPGLGQLLSLSEGEELAYINTIIKTNTAGLPGKSIEIPDRVSGGIVTNPVADGDCYSAPVNTIGIWEGCEDMLIVDISGLRAVAATGVGGDQSYSILHDGNTYTFDDSNFNVFTGKITDMSGLFKDDLTFNGDIGYWDTSNNVTMHQMFRSAVSFDQNIGGWDTSNVTSMRQTFHDASSFDQDISNWDTSEVEDMFYTFREASVFNQDISDWDTSKVDDMGHMFRQAFVFNQDISDWDTSKVNEMNHMFHDAFAFNHDLRCWDVSLIPGKPNNFADDSPIDLNTLIPVWGTDGSACPNP